MTKIKKRPVRVVFLPDAAETAAFPATGYQVVEMEWGGDAGGAIMFDGPQVAMREYEDTGWEPDLDWLYARIGCRTVEYASLPDVGQLWIDEEGKLSKRPLNLIGTLLYQAAALVAGVGAIDDVIVGPAILVMDPTNGSAEDADELLGSLAASAKELMRVIRGEAPPEPKPEPKCGVTAGEHNRGQACALPEGHKGFCDWHYSFHPSYVKPEALTPPAKLSIGGAVAFAQRTGSTDDSE
jgi:hypothetical protein